MASRFGPSNGSGLHQRADPRSTLFSGYTPSSTSSIGATGSSRNSSPAPSRLGAPANYHQGSLYGGPSAYSASAMGVEHYHQQGGPAGIIRSGSAGFRPATPNRKGQYSDAVLNELESQNEAQVEGILGKVKVLKEMSVQIGDEIRESSAIAEKMNDAFDNTRVRLRGTMNRMLLMAERTGIGWRVWLGFFALVIFLFWYVWLF